VRGKFWLAFPVCCCTPLAHFICLPESRRCTSSCTTVRKRAFSTNGQKAAWFVVAVQGDFYHYTALSPADQEKVKQNPYYYNRDYYGIMYKVMML
jgi:hypothetical protein